MPRPIVNHETSQYDDRHEYSPDCACEACRARSVSDWLRHSNAKPVMRLPLRFWLLALALSAAIILAGGIVIAHAKPPVARARQACPAHTTIVQCRGKLVRAYRALEWQKDARQHTEAMTVQAITRDAITWASNRWGVSAADMTSVSNCESHLWPFAETGQYKGAWQLGSFHLTDPIFAVVPWQDAYAQASHVARFVRAHGWGQWQCLPGGGLRW